LTQDCSAQQSTVWIQQLETAAKAPQLHVPNFKFEGVAYNEFLTLIEQMFQQATENSLHTWNHYTTPKVDEATINSLIVEFKAKLSDIFELISEFRGLCCWQHCPDLVQWKEWHALFLILALAQIRNCNYALSWATALTLSAYSQGSRACSIAVNWYFGTHVSGMYIKDQVRNFMNASTTVEPSY